ncbi:MAG TPA: hypothetical protein CFH84_02780 [Sulfurimonas sp. UBA12504]|nr:MAG TPA: hypothetical protein CFH84_02780 [Sulfurimonas sp. UBA12504]
MLNPEQSNAIVSTVSPLTGAHTPALFPSIDPTIKDNKIKAVIPTTQAVEIKGNTAPTNTDTNTKTINICKIL